MLLKCLQANPCHLHRKLIEPILNLAKMILVDVGKVQKRVRKRLFYVMSLKKDASAFKE